MKFYTFTCLLVVVMAEDILIGLYDDTDVQMQETIEQEKYTRLLTNCDNDEINQSVNEPSELEQKSKSMEPSKLFYNIPAIQNYVKNQQSYANNWLQQYGYRLPAQTSPLGTLPQPYKNKQQRVFHTPEHIYNPTFNSRLKDNFGNGNVKIRDQSQYNSNYNQYYKNYHNQQNKNKNNYNQNNKTPNTSGKKNRNQQNTFNNNYNQNSKTPNTSGKKNRNQQNTFNNNYNYNNNNNHNNYNNKTPNKQGDNNKSVNCNNGYCTICVNQRCKQCLSGKGQCQLCVGKSCSTVFI